MWPPWKWTTHVSAAGNVFDWWPQLLYSEAITVCAKATFSTDCSQPVTVCVRGTKTGLFLPGGELFWRVILAPEFSTNPLQTLEFCCRWRVFLPNPSFLSSLFHWGQTWIAYVRFSLSPLVPSPFPWWALSSVHLFYVWTCLGVFFSENLN